MVDQLDGVKLFLAAAAGGQTLLVGLVQVCTERRAVLPTSDGDVAGAWGTTSVGSVP